MKKHDVRNGMILVKILKKILRIFASRTIQIVFALKSVKNGISSWFMSDNILLENPYKGEKILLIALYEKGFLRNDIKNFLSIAKARGLYVIGINTQKLSADECVATWFDCYIERFNFGRDFGSYKAGFKHIFKYHYHEKCPRLLMINDSVFYESTRSERFIDDLINTSVEVLGATENFEITHHLGSFCISICGKILQHKKFIQYWHNYRNSDVRSTVIVKGEMALSVCLKKLVTTPNHFCALYDITMLMNALQANEYFLNVVLKTARRGKLYKVSLIKAREQLKQFLLRYCIADIEKIENILGYHPIFDLADMTEIIKKISESTLDKNLSQLKKFIIANIVKSFRRGSQIHLNLFPLFYLGLPLIKLDIFYRGAFSEEDLLILFEQMDQKEVKELQMLLLRNSYGGDSLFGLNRFLFELWLI